MLAWLGKMATVVVGVLFEDHSFFNCLVPEPFWQDLLAGVHSNWNLQRWGGEKASQLGLNLTSPNAVSMTEGGINPDRAGVNVLITPDVAALWSQPHAASAPLPHSNELDSEASLTDSSSTCADGKWTHSAVLLLIELYRTRRHLLSDPFVTKRKMFGEIAREMAKKNHMFSGDACCKKIENMKTRYKIIKDKNGRTGHGRSSWVYFDVMDEMMRGDPAITPPVTISSLGGVTVATKNTQPMTPPAGSTTPPAGATPPPAGLTPPPAEELTPLPRAQPMTPSGPTPGGRKRRRDRKNDIQVLLVESQKRTEDALNRLTAAVETKNEILKQLLEKL